jgi:hypothetical protein
MTTPEEQLEQTMDTAQGLIDQFSAIAGDAAKKIDAGEYSLDDRVKAAHKMFELAILGGVLWTQAWISAPALWGGKLEAELPEPSDPITVPVNHTDERTIEVSTPFKRQGEPGVVIPKQFIKFTPAKLAPGVTKFQMCLLDSNFSGFMYEGAVKLKTAAGVEFVKSVTTEL